MDKTAIKNFSIWARNKLIADITYKAGLLGVTEEGIKDALPQSTQDAEFYDIGTKEPYAIHGEEIKQRKKLVAAIKKKATQLDHKDAYRNVVEEVAYTWFNRLIAIRFMEVNDYMPFEFPHFLNLKCHQAPFLIRLAGNWRHNRTSFLK